MISAMEDNTAITVVGYLLTVGVALSWVFVSKQERIPRTRRVALGISLRTLPLFLLLLLACHGLGLNAALVFAILAIVLWVSLMGPFSSSIGATAILYVIQQWILGWPDRDNFILAPPSSCDMDHVQQDELIGRVGVACCPLRPGGLVVLDETEYPAYSDLGYIERGAQVIVTGRKGTSLLVRSAGSAPAEPAQS